MQIWAYSKKGMPLSFQRDGLGIRTPELSLSWTKMEPNELYSLGMFT